MDIILIRHTAVDVPPGTCYGQTDVPLRSTFPQEAGCIDKQLDRFRPFDAVYTSPLSRCVRLAEWCGYSDAVREARLMELNFGEWEMKRYDDIHDPHLKDWYADYLHVPATGGESFMEQLGRVSSFLDELRTTSFSKVALFTHGGVIACAQVYAGCVAIENAFQTVPGYGGVVHVSL